MSKPTILAVDDDPVVSRAVTRDLRARYGADYRIVAATSGAEALEVLAELMRHHDAHARRPAETPPARWNVGQHRRIAARGGNARGSRT